MVDDVDSVSDLDGLIKRFPAGSGGPRAVTLLPRGELVRSTRLTTFPGQGVAAMKPHGVRGVRLSLVTIDMASARRGRDGRGAERCSIARRSRASAAGPGAVGGVDGAAQ